MRIGFPREVVHMEGMARLIQGIDQRVEDIEWIHAPPGENKTPLFLEGDACFPFKRMVHTSLSLLSFVDVLILPRIVRLDGFLMCPNFRALPDIVEMNIKRMKMKRDVPVVSPLVEIHHPDELEGIAKKTSKCLLQGCENHYPAAPFLEKLKKQKTEAQDLSHTIAIIAHPYVLAESRLNMGVPEMIRENGFETISAQDIPFQELSRLAQSADYYAKKMYWRAGREILGSFLYFTQVKRPAGIIQLVAFNCGIEALLRIELMSLYRKMRKPLPYMVLVCDEHTQREHLVTRIEAFLDMVYGIRIQ